MGNTVLDSTRLDSTINEHGTRVINIIIVIPYLIIIVIFSEKKVILILIL